MQSIASLSIKIKKASYELNFNYFSTWQRQLKYKAPYDLLKIYLTPALTRWPLITASQIHNLSRQDKR